ncbi:MAG: hypothetical protein WB810_12590 [Candidatus Cybelea sp.]
MAGSYPKSIHDDAITADNTDLAKTIAQINADPASVFALSRAGFLCGVNFAMLEHGLVSFALRVRH